MLDRAKGAVQEAEAEIDKHRPRHAPLRPAT
jgi:hypothetical protein